MVRTIRQQQTPSERYALLEKLVNRFSFTLMSQLKPQQGVVSAAAGTVGGRPAVYPGLAGWAVLGRVIGEGRLTDGVATYRSGQAGAGMHH